jgi:hypothetical protein
MIYFGYPLDIHEWKIESETESDTKPKTEPENRRWETIPKPEPAGPKTRVYPTWNRSAAILTQNYRTIPRDAHFQLLAQALATTIQLPCLSYLYRRVVKKFPQKQLHFFIKYALTLILTKLIIYNNIFLIIHCYHERSLANLLSLF